jgi:galactokinase
VKRKNNAVVEVDVLELDVIVILISKEINVKYVQENVITRESVPIKMEVVSVLLVSTEKNVNFNKPFGFSFLVPF